jgi:tight adherence protein C
MGLSGILQILGVLAGGAAVFVAVSIVIKNIIENQNQPLSWASGDSPKKSKSGIIRLSRPLVHRLVLPLIARYELKDQKERIRRNIQSAGLGQELNENEYLGLQIFLGLFLPLFIIACNFLFHLEYPWFLILIFGVLGFVFPTYYVKGHKEIRRAQVLIDLPFVVDLLALSTEAGLDFIGAITKVVEKMTGGPLAEELEMVLRDLKLGSSRAEALNALAWRLNMGEVSSFIAVLTTADSMGASIGNILRQQSEQLRQERFMRAEKAGAEASQKIFIPIVLFILPAVLLIVFGPVVIQFMGGIKI